MGHLEKIKMGYFEHMSQAFLYSFAAFEAGIIFFIHGLFPDIFETTGSEIIHDLYSKLGFSKNIKNY